MRSENGHAEAINAEQASKQTSKRTDHEGVREVLRHQHGH